MVHLIENWLLIIFIIVGIVTMNVLIGKSKESKEELRKRKARIKRRYLDE